MERDIVGDIEKDLWSEHSIWLDEQRVTYKGEDLGVAA